MDPKYSFFEVVMIRPARSSEAQAAGLEGAVLGRVEDEPGKWYYAVHVYELAETWYVAEEDLEATGRHDRRETFYDGTSLRVEVDPETGEGRVVD